MNLNSHEDGPSNSLVKAYIRPGTDLTLKKIALLNEEYIPVYLIFLTLKDSGPFEKQYSTVVWAVEQTSYIPF